jgi:hypothetical protein
MAERPTPQSLPPSSDGRLSRRQALTAAGVLAAAGAASTSPAQAAPATAARGGMVGIAPAPDNAVEFRAQFRQTGSSGENFEAFGYLTQVAGARDGELFAGAPGESTALFTAYAKGTLVNRIHDGSPVHTLDVDGTLTVYQRPAPGATFADPGSFRVGTPVAEFAVNLQDVLTVFAPGQGLPSLNGSLRQTASDKLLGAPANRRFGHVGSRARLSATGIGTLTDAATLNSTLDMAGNWVVE